MGKFKTYVLNHIAAQPDKTQKIYSTPAWLVSHLYGLFAVICLRICLLASILNKGKHLNSKRLQLFDVA